MSAPLHSRFRRYWDRDAKPYPDKVRNIARDFKKPARIYSLSPRAAFEAGALSGATPKDLLQAYEALYDPGGLLWIEFPWHDMIAGMKDAGIPTPEMTYNHPVRVAFLVVPKKITMDDQELKGEFASLIYYLYPTGRTVLGPVICMLGTSAAHFDNATPEYQEDFEKLSGVPYATIPFGPGYLSKWAGTSMKKAATELAMLGGISMLNFPEKGVNYRKTSHRVVEDGAAIIRDVNGTCRLILSVLATVLYAKPAKYRSDPDLPARDQRPGRGAGTLPGVVEIDLFVKPNVRAGGTILSHIKAAERAKKRRHDVLAHWNYRQRKDGSDPRTCPDGSRHLFEKIEGTKSEVCLKCDQKRWFRDRHERGDETRGWAPQKVYNVRAG